MVLMTAVKAVIQAGGRGTRLAPYSTILPKALMPVGDGTVIDNALTTLARGGVVQVFVIVNRMGQLIRSYCGDGSRWSLSIEYLEETTPLGTIGGLDLLREQLTHTFLVLNSDVYLDLDVQSLVRFHREREADLTVVTTEQKVKIDYGVLDTDGGRVVMFREKPTEKYCVSSGVYCFEPAVLREVPRATPFGFDDLVERLVGARRRVFSYHHAGYWIDIGRIEDLRRAQNEAGRASQHAAHGDV
jgi:mannose-1-phosphate guanylyltransferase